MNSELLDALKANAYRHYLALWLVPPAQRDFALALFSLDVELQSISHKVTNPAIGMMRVVWWRDALLALGQDVQSQAQPVIKALQAYPQFQAELVTFAESFEGEFEADETARLGDRKKREETFSLLMQGAMLAAQFLSKSKGKSDLSALFLACRMLFLRF